LDSMKHYSTYQSQFIEMFNEKGYPLAMIKSFADVSTGGTPSKANPEYWNGDKPWVSAEDMKNKYVYDTLEKVTEAGYATCKIIPVDTLMYVCRGSIGVMAINKIECATNQSICRAKCHDNVCNVEFLYHALMYQRDNIKKMGTGTSFKSLNQTSFSELKIELPPYNEQMKFVSIAQQSDKSKFTSLKSQFIEMFAFQDLSLTNPSDDFGKKCYDDTSSATKVPAGDYKNNGRYAIYDQSQDCDIAGYTDSIEGVCNNYPAVLFGDHSRVIKYIDQPFYIGADGVKIIRPKGNDLLPEFLYYDLLYHNIPNTGYNRHFKYVKMLKLTEASIDRQKEFLKIANQADKSKFELRQSIEKIDRVIQSLLN